METRTLAEVRAADADTLYSLYFPEGRVSAAAAVGCVCIDYLTCSECERILGHSFLAIADLGKSRSGKSSGRGPGRARKVRRGSLRHGGPARAGLAPTGGRGRGVQRGSRNGGPAGAGLAGSDAAISSKADRLGPGSHPPSHVVEGFEAAIYSMAARLGLPAAVGERAKDVFRKMDEARAWPPGPGRGKDWSKDRSKGPLAYAACLSIACRTDGLARLGEADEAAALVAVRRLEGDALDVRHNPDSVAAAVVCLALERAGAARKPLKDVATATGIPYHTIYRVCTSLRPHAGLLFG
ncbi:hypothetical protein ACQ4PT_030006 [Festuca glaucescens]